MRRIKRHVLKAPVCEGLESGHPWVFRDKVGDDRALVDGDWLQLVDPGGAVVGTGVYQAEGGVAIRVFRLGHRPVTAGYLKARLEQAIERRAGLLAETDAYRVLNGESDGFPGVVIDVYGSIGVLQTYSPGVDALGRFAAGFVADRLGLGSVVWKAPSKRVGGPEMSNRVLRGEKRPYVVKFHESRLQMAADLFSGQKSGTYLDLRGLRRYLLGLDLSGKRVLNLFAYTGMSGLACAAAGAREVINVDAAQPSLDFGRRYHKGEAMKWVCADVFPWIDALKARDFDLIIVDPPSMASNKTQVLKALKIYHRLYSTLLTKLKPGGTLIACCCTSRISPREFEEKVSFALRPMSRKLALPMELDHRPAFAEADYLKVLVFRQDSPLPTTSKRRSARTVDKKSPTADSKARGLIGKVKSAAGKGKTPTGKGKTSAGKARPPAGKGTPPAGKARPAGKGKSVKGSGVKGVARPQPRGSGSKARFSDKPGGKGDGRR